MTRYAKTNKHENTGLDRCCGYAQRNSNHSKISVSGRRLSRRGAHGNDRSVTAVGSRQPDVPHSETYHRKLDLVPHLAVPIAFFARSAIQFSRFAPARSGNSLQHRSTQLLPLCVRPTCTRASMSCSSTVIANNRACCAALHPIQQNKVDT